MRALTKNEMYSLAERVVLRAGFGPSSEIENRFLSKNDNEAASRALMTKRVVEGVVSILYLISGVFMLVLGSASTLHKVKVVSVYAIRGPRLLEVREWLVVSKPLVAGGVLLCCGVLCILVVGIPSLLEKEQKMSTRGVFLTNVLLCFVPGVFVLMLASVSSGVVELSSLLSLSLADLSCLVLIKCYEMLSHDYLVYGRNRVRISYLSVRNEELQDAAPHDNKIEEVPPAGGGGSEDEDGAVDRQPVSCRGLQCFDSDLVLLGVSAILISVSVSISIVASLVSEWDRNDVRYNAASILSVFVVLSKAQYVALRIYKRAENKNEVVDTIGAHVSNLIPSSMIVVACGFSASL